MDNNEPYLNVEMIATHSPTPHNEHPDHNAIVTAGELQQHFKSYFNGNHRVVITGFTPHREAVNMTLIERGLDHADPDG